MSGIEHRTLSQTKYCFGRIETDFEELFGSPTPLLSQAERADRRDIVPYRECGDVLESLVAPISDAPPFVAAGDLARVFSLARSMNNGALLE